jgi:hypothetical protein
MPHLPRLNNTICVLIDLGKVRRQKMNLNVKKTFKDVDKNKQKMSKALQNGNKNEHKNVKKLAKWL